MTSTIRLFLAAAAAASLVACSTQASEPMISSDSSESAANVLSLSRPQTLSADSEVQSSKKVKVVVRVLVDSNGQRSQAEISKPSGYPTFDKAALDTVARWKFVPGKRDGVVQPMWHMAPLIFHLK